MRKIVAHVSIVLIAMIAITSSVYGQDSHEPNDALGDATEIPFNQTVIGYIYPAGDGDYYKFYLSCPGILQVKLEEVPSDMRTRIDLYGKNFNWITRKDATNAGDTVTLEIDIANPGWYYIGIADLDGLAHNAEYTFKVLFEPVIDSKEPNDILGDATEITFNQTVRGYIYPAVEWDSYKFHLNSSGILQVKLEEVPSDMRTRIDLYGKNFNWITRKDATNAGDTVTLERDIDQPGWYYIGIGDLDGHAHNVEYAFKVLFEPVVDSKETNNAMGDATEITFNQTVRGYIFPAGDGDFYKFYLNSSGILQVKLEGVPSYMRTRIDLYGKNFNWITCKYATNAGDTVTLKIDIANPGWCYIGIGDLDGLAHNVEYAFKVLFEPVIDSKEPNNVLGDATEITFNQTVRGYIFPAGEWDDYKFHVNNLGILQVKLEEVPSDMRTRIDLYGKNFNWITCKDATNAGDTVNLERDIDQPGWYYIGIGDLEGQAHNVEYAFKVLLV
jgi:hypothetical protein